MTSAHVFYIPLVLLVGLILGFVLGRKATLAQADAEDARSRSVAGTSRPWI